MTEVVGELVSSSLVDLNKELVNDWALDSNKTNFKDYGII
jgi:hypothetical protein